MIIVNRMILEHLFIFFSCGISGRLWKRKHLAVSVFRYIFFLLFPF